MDKKLKYFTYSQNSLNTFKSCPLKFKYKYIDDVNWKFDTVESRDYYEGLKTGSEFHLLCERYFKNIPLGENINDEFKTWLEKIKALISISEDKVYLSEYEARTKILDSYISAKYDLIILEKDKIEIWDWKTESQSSSYKNVENRMQTIVYMYLAREVVQKIHKLNIPIENISMNYLRLKLDNKPIVVNYNEQKHIRNKAMLEDKIKTINNIDFAGYLKKNDSHCEFCEFNKLCNNKPINYEQIEEDEYGA